VSGETPDTTPGTAIVFGKETAVKLFEILMALRVSIKREVSS
jgi:hypothetical protein